jgi:integrase
MQQGSLLQSSRKVGPDVWLFRWSEKDHNGRRIYRKNGAGKKIR